MGTALFYFIPAALNIFIFLYACLKLPQNRTNNSFSIFVFLLGAWQISEGMMRLGNTAETTSEWNTLSACILCMMVPMALLFVFRVTKFIKKVSDPKVLVLLFLPAFFFELCEIARLDDFTIVPSEQWNWVANPGKGAVSIAFMSWTLTVAITMLVLLWRYLLKVKGAGIQKKQAVILVIGFTVPIIIGILSEILLPVLFGVNNVPIAPVSVTFFSAMALVAVMRYDMLDFSPRHQWDKLVNALNDGIMIVDAEDKIMFANKKFCQILEYSLEEMKGRFANELFLPPVERKEFVAVLEERKNNIASEYEIRLITRSGKLIWFIVSGAPYFDRSGNIVGSIGVHTDITKIKDAEEQLRLKINELNSFFYKTSHDLKGPIVNIKALIDLYQKGTEKNTEELIDLIETSNYHSLLIVDNLSRITSILKKTVNRDLLDIETNIKDIMKTIVPVGISVRLRTEFLGNKQFTTDKELFSIAVRNILDNAIRFRDKVKKDCFVILTCLGDDEKIIVRIADNGIGMSESCNEKIFNIFYKGEEASGLGLGLYTSRCAVERLGGTISAKSKTGEGSEFTIIIPIRPRRIESGERKVSTV